MSVLIKDFPPEIRRKAAYWRHKHAVDKEADNVWSAFSLNSTPEKHEAWRKIHNGDFSSFPNKTSEYPEDFKDFKDPYETEPVFPFKIGEEIECFREATKEDWGVGCAMSLVIGQKGKVKGVGRPLGKEDNKFVAIESGYYPVSCFKVVQRKVVSTPDDSKGTWFCDITSNLAKRGIFKGDNFSYNCYIALPHGRFILTNIFQYKEDILELTDSQYEELLKKDPTAVKGVLPKAESIKNTNSSLIDSNKDLLEEAKRRYPIGTKFYTAHIDKENYLCTVSDFNYLKMIKDHIVLSYGNTKKNGHPYAEVLWYKGRWAEIVKDEVKKEPVKTPDELLIEEAKRRYPIGTKYICAHPGVVKNEFIVGKQIFTLIDSPKGSIDAGVLKGWLKYGDKWAEIITSVPEKWYLIIDDENYKLIEEFRGYSLNKELNKVVRSIGTKDCIGDNEANAINAGYTKITTELFKKHIYIKSIPTEPIPPKVMFQNDYDKLPCWLHYGTSGVHEYVTRVEGGDYFASHLYNCEEKYLPELKCGKPRDKHLITTDPKVIKMLEKKGWWPHPSKEGSIKTKESTFFLKGDKVRFIRNATPEEWKEVGMVTLPKEITDKAFLIVKESGNDMLTPYIKVENCSYSIPSCCFEKIESTKSSKRIGQVYKVEKSAGTSIGTTGNILVLCFDDTSSGPGFCRLEDYKGELSRSEFSRISAIKANYVELDCLKLLSNDYHSYIKEHTINPASEIHLTTTSDGLVLRGDLPGTWENISNYAMEDVSHTWKNHNPHPQDKYHTSIATLGSLYKKSKVKKCSLSIATIDASPVEVKMYKQKRK